MNDESLANENLDIISYAINAANELSFLLDILDRGDVSEKDKSMLIAYREYGEEILRICSI